MSAARVQLAGCALIAALLLPGCGSGGSGTTGASTIASKAGGDNNTKTTTTAKAPKSSAGTKHRARAGSLCQTQLGSFVGSMDGLRRRLAVGVTYDQYVNEVHAIRSTYKSVPVDTVEIDCLNAVGAPAEKAFNRYIEAANDWGECVSELGCSSATVEPILQRRWRIASHLLTEAEDGLRGLSH
ncbi:MAG: hypothetical protein ACTHNP_09150 [Solirubrobacterales bacterium]